MTIKMTIRMITMIKRITMIIIMVTSFIKSLITRAIIVMATMITIKKKLQYK